jgi:hypothetical protein
VLASVCDKEATNDNRDLQIWRQCNLQWQHVHTVMRSMGRSPMDWPSPQLSSAFTLLYACLPLSRHLLYCNVGKITFTDVACFGAEADSGQAERQTPCVLPTKASIYIYDYVPAFASLHLDLRIYFIWYACNKMIVGLQENDRMFMEQVKIK